MARASPHNPNRWFFDFDAAAPGGKGGAGVLVDLALGLASIDGVHKNMRMPRRSTGGLVADGLRQIGIARPAMLEGYNVEKTTRTALAAGGDGQGTLIGNLLADTVKALGGTITRWEPVADGRRYHLRVHLTYP